MTILIADDNFTNRLLLKGILIKLGHKPITVENGKDALEKVKTDTFDIIFMDIEMPMMNGITATKHIRKLPPPKGTLPIIAFTAHQQGEMPKKFAETGFNTMVTKPYNGDKIKNVLDKFV